MPLLLTNDKVPFARRVAGLRACGNIERTRRKHTEIQEILHQMQGSFSAYHLSNYLVVLDFFHSQVLWIWGDSPLQDDSSFSMWMVSTKRAWWNTTLAKKTKNMWAIFVGTSSSFAAASILPLHTLRTYRRRQQKNATNGLGPEAVVSWKGN